MDGKGPRRNNGLRLRGSSTSGARLEKSPGALTPAQYAKTLAGDAITMLEDSKSPTMLKAAARQDGRLHTV